ncbi:MAG: glycosyltransferase, partial [Candidatus Didemnitutus sp.]|nr:glycosyltransferase [Candidatus Didemnitutus sp.]
CPVFVQVATTLDAERRAATNGGGWKAGLRHLTTRMARRLEQRGLQETAGVFVENRWMADHVGALRKGTGVYFAPPGVDTDYLQPDPLAERKHLLFVGRMDDRRKNLALLLKAYAQYLSRNDYGVPLVLAGFRGPLPEHRQLIDDLGLTAKVTIHAGPTRAELRGLYQTAKLVALSSNEEGLGMVLVEGMACGAPVLSTDCGGPRTIVNSGKNGLLVPVGDVEAFASALERMLTNPGMVAAMGGEARRNAVMDFSLEAAGRRFTEIYEKAPFAQRRAPDHDLAL